jgi:hypothetical protein
MNIAKAKKNTVHGGIHNDIYYKLVPMNGCPFYILA